MHMAKFKRVVVAGTFNCIHRGHGKLLRTAIESGERVLVGLTSDEFARKLKGEARPYEERKRTLEEELAKLGGAGMCEIVKIDDEVGMAGELAELGAIVVSEETEGNTRGVNGGRKARGLE